MLRNCEKIITPISSSTNQCPQNQLLDDRKTFMASSSANKAMEKINQDHPPPHHHQSLRCPRCDSSNTKFCYYNNYSLSQPRHFCKACKRYWTRGGTLRNVPVGGGCRKNKRPKRQPSGEGDGASSAAASTATANPSVQPKIDLSPPASNRMHNPLFYSLPSNPLELNFSFSSFRVSSDATGFDLQPQMNGLGLGFSSGLVANEVINNEYKNGFKPIQDVISNSSSTSPFSASGNNNDYNSFYGSSNFASTSTIASLLASSHHHQKSPGLMPYEDPQMPGQEVKLEGENGSIWNQNQSQNPVQQVNSSDPSSLLWNTTNLGAWFDSSNIGSSVPSLI